MASARTVVTTITNEGFTLNGSEVPAFLFPLCTDEVLVSIDSRGST